MNNNRYWIWLSLALGYDNPKVKRLYETEEYRDISVFYNGQDFEWRFCGIFTEKEINHLEETPIEKADEIISKCESLGYSIFAIDNDRYPNCLRNIDTPPAVIYVSGYLPRVDNLLTIAIVGTRKATTYGKKVAYSISHNLSKCKVTIISGGALVTADIAGKEQGKDVFAVMANINSVYSVGSNQLIKDGAIPVTTYLDILNYYNEFNNLEVYEDDEYDIPDSTVLKIPAKKSNEKPEKEFIKGHRYDVKLDENSSKVYYAIGNEPIHIDDLSDKCNLPVYKISGILTNLELMDLIVVLPGKQYKIK